MRSCASSFCRACFSRPKPSAAKSRERPLPPSHSGSRNASRGRRRGSSGPPIRRRPTGSKRVFPRLKFQGPVCIAQEPDTNRLLVAENNGKIFSFPIDDPDADKPELFLDLKRPTYAFSFHPRYKENGQVFVFCPEPAAGTPGPKMSRVSRFRTGLEYPRRIRPGFRGGHHRVAGGRPQRGRGDHRA